MTSHRLNSTKISEFIVEIIITFFLGVVIEAISYFRYTFLVKAYAEAAREAREG